MTLEEFKDEWQSDVPYITAHTSGSTGQPKEIRLLKADMRLSAIATNRRFGIDSSSVLAIPLSMDYIAGKMMAVRAFEAGCRLMVLPVSNRLEIRGHVDLLAIVPSQSASLIADCDIENIGNVIVGGAKISAADRAMLADAPFNAYCTYGMTETCSHVALADIRDSSLTYRAMPGIGFSTDERGCLCISSQTMSFGSLQTNDVVELIDRESFRWIGRADNVINSGGIKIMAEKLEELLSVVIKSPFYVTAYPHPKWGEVPVVVVESDSSALPRLESAVDALNLGISRPQRIVCVDCLPRTSNGKIRRIRL